MEGKEKPELLTLAYIKEFSEEIEQAIRPLNIRAVFKSQITIQQKFMRVKEKTK